MAQHEKPQRPQVHPDALAVGGRALERVGRLHGDLPLVRRGLKDQAEARKLKASSPKPRS